MKAYLIGCLLLVVSLFSGVLHAAFSDQVGKDWTTVKRGTSVAPVEFTKQGQILFHEGQCSLPIADEDETTTEIEFSAISPDTEYRIVIADVYDFQPGYLLDVKKCGLMHLPLPRYFQPWVSWAPDGQHVLFFTNYEASPQLWLLKLETGQIFEVHRSGLKLRADTCCGLNEWAPKSGVGYLNPESLRWSDATSFTFRLEIFCNPYSDAGGWPCESGDPDHARAAYEVSVVLDPSKVTSGPRIKLPVRQSAPKR
jgi:hypothetical protein